MFKFRELVHNNKGDVGVPANLKAAERPNAMKKRQVSDTEGRKAKLMNWITEHPGEEVKLDVLSHVAGYKGRTNSWEPLRQLELEGKLRKLRQHNGTRYWPAELRPDLPVGDKRNGPVLVSKATEVKEPVKPTAPTVPIALIPPVEAKRELVVAQEATFKEAFHKSLDDFAWSFLKGTAQGRNNTNLAETTRLLMRFSDFVKKQIDGEPNEAQEKEAAKL